ncbi:oxygen-independent coproporphyrinogen III oxidase [Chelativorans sp. AA-79]|uniref:oxygen-independent coproporphyrinogen III oxidase n=1 Tax=Chelativorans sp. AA-79 TaxID=3028735 RepID=UPI0023F682DB|nr:oxygen-independent coproporphyrinogen III oxidase [Chelativorans sp. AA-79]WEX08561.1 oxygen-independent coproporphyrinogen III oxidase [Chelativorans sp. AA-79]
MTRFDPTARFQQERLPRYTSYPTAPHFSDAISQETYGRWLAFMPGGVSGSLYVHIPFCRSMCWYCGCHTTITKHDAPIDDYLSILTREINLVADRIGQIFPVRHVHFGGGTPTIMAPGSFVELVTLIRKRFPFAADAEIAVEIDPRTLSDTTVSALSAAGVTRASLGVQSLDPVVQRAVNRVQDLDQIARATEDLRNAGISGVNFDLIYGLPHQTVVSCVETVLQCVALRPDRFAVFGYAHVPQFKKHQRKIDEATLADSTGRLAQAEAIAALLMEAGYKRIGFDHFALPDDAITRAQSSGRLRRNFQGYTTDPGDVLIGFGASAIGRLSQGYVQNEVALPRYAERIARGELATSKGYALTADDRLRAEVIERLMCDFRVDVDEVCRKHAVRPDVLLHANQRLCDLVAEGLVEIDGPIISVSEEASILVRSVASAFDAYLGSSNRPYSRAV